MQTEETRLRLALGHALHHVRALEASHGIDIDKDHAGIIAVRLILSNALKNKPTPSNIKLHQISAWLIIIIHGLCFACVFLGFLIKG